jgi:hypothetical protein
MTHVIDHAIQIPVSTSDLWQYISNPENNTAWQQDYKSLSFLNSIRRGIGMRWRYSDKNGREYVIDVTAWYDGLGFEYSIVDGVAYTPNKGRIRLQEVAEGTVVQWTFSYELQGMLGNLRNSLGTRRNLDNLVVESLRTLYRVSTQKFKELNLGSTRAQMQDAPNVLERSEYKPRHPSVLQEGKPRPSPTPIEAMSPVPLQPTPTSFTPQYEPPVADDDTRPNQVATIAPVQSEPTFVQPTTPVPSPFAPQQPVSITPTMPANDARPVTESSKPTIADLLRSTGEIPRVTTDSTSMKPVDVPPVILPVPPVTPLAPIAKEDSQPVRSITSTDTQAKVDLSKLNKDETATISVFEVFGLQRPSETQELHPVNPKIMDALDTLETTASGQNIITDDVTRTPDVPKEAMPPVPVEPVTSVPVKAKEVVETTIEPVEEVIKPEQTSADVKDIEPVEPTLPQLHKPIWVDVLPEIMPRIGLRRVLRHRLYKSRLQK